MEEEHRPQVHEIEEIEGSRFEFDSYKIDVKNFDKEFECKLCSHFLSNPVITTCCGRSACL